MCETKNKCEINLLKHLEEYGLPSLDLVIKSLYVDDSD